MHLVAGGKRYTYAIVTTRMTSFRSKRSLAQQSAAVPGKIGAEPTKAMITLSTCRTQEDHAEGNYWSDRFRQPRAPDRQDRRSRQHRGAAMTQFSGYLTTEVVEDYSDGVINRREALRRLGLLGVSVAVAVPLLAACSTPEPTVNGGASSAPPPSPAGPPALPTEAITFAGAESRTLQAAWAPAADPRGAVLVVHENRGLTDHIRSVAGRLAASGYSALAIDLLSAEGGTAIVRRRGVR